MSKINDKALEAAAKELTTQSKNGDWGAMQEADKIIARQIAQDIITAYEAAIWSTDMEAGKKASKNRHKILVYIPTFSSLFTSYFEYGCWQEIPWMANPAKPTHWKHIDAPSLPEVKL